MKESEEIDQSKSLFRIDFMKNIVLFGAFLVTCLAASAQNLALQKGDRICIIGNGLADRLQHSGYLEALIYEKFPAHDLVFRNLAVAGDEIELSKRFRSEAFGTPDEWLTNEKADVIFAFFGYNESYKGYDGLDAFRKDLDKFIKDTLKQNYSGKGAPRLVLFSPIAQEKNSDPNFPDPSARNGVIRDYSRAMADVTKANGVQFVDLVGPSEQIFAKAKNSLTINGVHLSDAGYEALAPAAYQSLLNEAAPAMNGTAFEKLKAAVNAKNEEFFKRYRTVDGYNVYGGRSHLKFDWVMNRDAMLREMEMRDVMTANRDQRIWAVAKGGDLAVKDNNLPPAVEVKSNKPGKNPDGSHVFLSGEDAIKHMTVPKGCKVNLFASEEQFPLLSKPVQMAFDTKGRLWVAAWPNYPEREPLSKKGDSLLVFEDTDGDGKADKCTPFLDDLNAPTGFQFYKDGVIVVQAPDLIFARDTNGDGKADVRERIVNGLDSADSHHTANAVVLDPGGAIYLSDGVFHRTQVESAWGPPVRNMDAAIYRYEPRSSKFERYIPYGFANPHGRVFDYWGNDLVTDATGNETFFGPAFSGYLDGPGNKHPGMKQFWARPSRPCPGTGILSSRHFPEEFQENFLNCNVISFQGIYRVKVTENGSGLKGETLENLVSSDDPNFRPSAVDVAPDGSVYFLDWHNPIIGHMQHHIRDPNRDHVHGRIYRMTYEGRPLTKPAKIAGQSIPNLLELLKEPENGVRTRAKIELGARDSKQVVAAVNKWARQFDPKKIEDQHALTEALWVHQWHNVVNPSLLRQMLASPEPRARAAAVRVLCYWRDRVQDPLSLLHTAANDESLRVRLEAIRAASFFRGDEALDVAYESQKYESDYYVDYTFKETARQLQTTIKGPYLPKDPKVLAAVVGKLPDKDLMQASEVPAVLVERITRKGTEVNARNDALTKLAAIHKTDRATEAVAALRRLDGRGAPATAVKDLATILGTMPPSDIASQRTALTQLAHDAKEQYVRSAAYAALVTADGKPNTVWSETEKNAAARVDLIGCIVMLVDPSFRTAFNPLLTAALENSKTPGTVRGAALRALPLMGPDNAAKSFDILAVSLRDGHDLSDAARAVMELPRASWKKDQAPAVTSAIVEWAKAVPASRRTSQDYVETVQVGIEMAALLPPADSARVRKSLLDLGVRVFAIKTVREQMRYDTTRIVVEAGKPFEIIFENTDMMPHNLVVVEPGAREEVGMAAQTMSPTPDKDGRAFIPKSKRILASSRLVEPGEKQTLKLTAPEKTGEYEYVCTYPEHWKIMFGQLVVVKNMDEVLQANAKPLPVQSVAAAGHEHHH